MRISKIGDSEKHFQNTWDKKVPRIAKRREKEARPADRIFCWNRSTSYRRGRQWGKPSQSSCSYQGRRVAVVPPLTVAADALTWDGITWQVVSLPYLKPSSGFPLHLRKMSQLLIVVSLALLSLTLSIFAISLPPPQLPASLSLLFLEHTEFSSSLLSTFTPKVKEKGCYSFWALHGCLLFIIQISVQWSSLKRDFCWTPQSKEIIISNSLHCVFTVCYFVVYLFASRLYFPVISKL